MSDESGLAGGVALITGADRGIGRALARGLGARGCCLVLHSWDGDGLARAVRDEGWQPERVLTAGYDVADAAAGEAAVTAAIERFGRIDHLLNVAGVAYPGGILDTAPETWERTLSTNLTGYFLIARAVLPHMKAAGSGRVVNLSSIWGRRAGPAMLAYSVSKWGVEGLTRAMAAEARPWGVRVCGIVLDKVDTLFSANMPVPPTTEQRDRMLSTEDVVHAVLAILTTSDRAQLSTIELDAWRWAP